MLRLNRVTRTISSTPTCELGGDPGEILRNSAVACQPCRAMLDPSRDLTLAALLLNGADVTVNAGSCE